jgi:hypothetical protein
MKTRRLAIAAGVVAAGLALPAAASAASCADPSTLLPTSAPSPLKVTQPTPEKLVAAGQYYNKWGILSPQLVSNLRKNDFQSGAVTKFTYEQDLDEAVVGVEVLGSAAQAKAQAAFESTAPQNKTNYKQHTLTSGAAKGYSLETPGGKTVLAALSTAVGPRVISVSVSFNDGGALAPAKSLMATTLKAVQACS